MKFPRALVLVAVLASSCQAATASEQAVNAPAAVRQAAEPAGLKTAIFAGGCYWGVEGVFSHVIGVTSAVSGFHGGSRITADYERVSTGTTGHAEAVQVTYDPAKIRYDQSPGTGQRHAVSRRVGAGLARATHGCSRLSGPVKRFRSVERPDRHADRTRSALLPRGQRSSGFHAEEPAPSLHPALGCAEGCGLAAALPRCLHHHVSAKLTQRFRKCSLRGMAEA